MAGGRSAGRGGGGLKLIASAGFFAFTGFVSAYQLWTAWADGTVWIGGGLGGGAWHSYSQSHGEYWVGVGIWALCLAGSLWLLSLGIGVLRRRWG